MQKRIWRNKSEQTELNNKRIWTATVAGNKKESAKNEYEETNLNKRNWTTKEFDSYSGRKSNSGSGAWRNESAEMHLKKRICTNEYEQQTNLNSHRQWGFQLCRKEPAEMNLKKRIWTNETEQQTNLNRCSGGHPGLQLFPASLGTRLLWACRLCCWFLVCTLLWFPLIDWLVDWLIKWMNRLMNTMFMN